MTISARSVAVEGFGFGALAIALRGLLDLVASWGDISRYVPDPAFIVDSVQRGFVVASRAARFDVASSGLAYVAAAGRARYLIEAEPRGYVISTRDDPMVRDGSINSGYNVG
jgi:hypothetical protein